MRLWIKTDYRELMVCTQCQGLWHVLAYFGTEETRWEQWGKPSCLECFNLSHLSELFHGFPHGSLQHVEIGEENGCPTVKVQTNTNKMMSEFQWKE
jgi:hypothetical protein